MDCILGSLSTGFPSCERSGSGGRAESLASTERSAHTGQVGRPATHPGTLTRYRKVREQPEPSLDRRDSGLQVGFITCHPRPVQCGSALYACIDLDSRLSTKLFGVQKCPTENPKCTEGRTETISAWSAREVWVKVEAGGCW